MNGPTRSSAFDRPAPVAGDRRRYDVFDELEQFVDAEPAWVPARRPERDPEPEPDPSFGDDAADGGAFAPDDLPSAHGDSGAGFSRDADRRVDAAARQSAAPARHADLDPAGEVAFSTVPEPRSERRDAFARRLSDELSRPQAAKPQRADPTFAVRQPPAAEEGEGDAEAARHVTLARSGPPRDSVAEPDRVQGTTAAEGTSAALDGEPGGTPVRQRAAARETRPVPVAIAPAAGGASPVRAAPPVPTTRRPYEAARDAARAVAEAAPDVPAEARDDAPADALDWELDNAIGEIIASGSGRGREDEPRALPPAPETDTGGAATYRATTCADAPRGEAAAADPMRGELARGDPVRGEQVRGDPARGEPMRGDTIRSEPVRGEPARGEMRGAQARGDPARSARGDGAGRGDPARSDPAARADGARGDAQLPAVVQSALTRRQKPVPSFSYARREEQHEPASVAPPDVDDPFATVFFPEPRDGFEQPRSAEPLALTLDLEGEDEGGFDDASETDAAGDELPPALSRAIVPHRRRGVAWRSPAVLSLLAGGVVILGLGIVGYGMIGGARPSSGAVRIIHADARDVKVRNDTAAADEGAASPDISESVALGDGDKLVVPGTVRLDTSAPAPEEDDSRAPRPVRTVVVRPDGSIVPSPDPAAPSGGAARGPAPYEVAIAGGAVASDTDAAAPRVIDTSPDAAPDDPVPAGEDAIGDLIPDGGVADPAAQTGDVAGGLDAGAADPPTAAAPPAERIETQLPPPRPTPPPRRAAKPVQEARAEPAAAPAEPAREGWGVQVSSQRTEGDAAAAYRALQQKYPAILRDRAPTISPARVGDRGTFYRVKVATSSQAEATALCQKLKAAGGDCFIGRN